MAKKKTTLAAKLKKLQGVWEETEPAAGGMSLPDDDYTGRITSAVLEESKNSNRLQINFAIQVLSPDDYEGKVIHKYQAMEEEKDLPYVQGTLETLEVEIPDDIADIGEALEECQGLVVDFTVKSKDDFVNIYFNEVLEDEEDDDKGKKGKKGKKAEPEEDEEDEEEITEDDVEAMDKKELISLVEEMELDIDPKDYKKVEALREAVSEALFED